MESLTLYHTLLPRRFLNGPIVIQYDPAFTNFTYELATGT